ncbi:MAG TPA: hypothetical protein VJT67_08280 [Longimicrobiaceae bacterium]|nr:hypothetical protein [Longimicrobiaceae bacterium]
MAPAHLTTEFSANIAASYLSDGFTPCTTGIVVLTHTAAGIYQLNTFAAYERDAALECAQRAAHSRRRGMFISVRSLDFEGQDDVELGRFAILATA